MSPTGPGPTPSARPAAAPARDEPVLDVGDIQGNILAGFNKDHQTLIGLRIHDVASCRAWLRRIEPAIASTAEVLQFNRMFGALRARRGDDPPGLASTWANIAFSAPGLRQLTTAAEVAAFPDEAFKIGLPLRAGLIHDPTAHGSPGAPDTWKVGRRDNIPDVLLIVASDEPSYLAGAVARLLPAAGDGIGGGALPEILWQEEGATRPDLPGHEHFGFKDSISQPGVRGYVSRGPDVFLTPRLLDPADPLAGQYGAPGQLLVWPGNFVLGYPAQAHGRGEVVDPPPPNPAWIRNGSFLVFRRLTQDVRGFRAFVEAQAARLAAQPGFAGMTPARLGAMMVGRWASGAPIVRSPQADDPALAADEDANNDFLYTRPSVAPKLRPGVPPPAFPPSPGDPAGVACPFSAHIRKVNPRDGQTDLGSEPDTPTRRILRRGVPFGPPLPDPAPDDDRAERGLHFLCYQASIKDQFETLMTNWVNNRTTPLGSVGEDPIIGQAVNGGAAAPRTFGVRSAPGAPPSVLDLLQPFVIASGGGYFFAPSLSALRDRLCRASEVI